MPNTAGIQIAAMAMLLSVAGACSRSDPRPFGGPLSSGGHGGIAVGGRAGDVDAGAGATGGGLTGSGGTFVGTGGAGTGGFGTGGLGTGGSATGGVVMGGMDGPASIRDASADIMPDVGAVDSAGDRPPGTGGGAGGGPPATCAAGLADCNNNPQDGCEVSLASTAHCGRCGNNCQAANSIPACVTGQCAPLVCTSGFADCNNNRVDGCETALDADSACGACDRRCVTPTPYCGLAGLVRTCMNPVQVLVDQRAETPCIAPLASSLELCESLANPATACPDAGKVLRRTFTVGGRPGAIYNVTLRIRGVVEPKVYTGGRGPGDHFYVGGAPTVTNFNTYSLAVSSPAQRYFLNYDEARGESHYVFPLDHTKVIQVASGATVSLEISDLDCVMVKNCQSFVTAVCAPYVVPGIPPAPVGFNGQFVHLDVVAVSPAP